MKLYPLLLVCILFVGLSSFYFNNAYAASKQSNNDNSLSSLVFLCDVRDILSFNTCEKIKSEFNLAVKNSKTMHRSVDYLKIAYDENIASKLSSTILDSTLILSPDDFYDGFMSSLYSQNLTNSHLDMLVVDNSKIEDFYDRLLKLDDKFVSSTVASLKINEYINSVSKSSELGITDTDLVSDCSYNGVKYGVPVGVDYPVLYYRSGLYQPNTGFIDENISTYSDLLNGSGHSVLSVKNVGVLNSSRMSKSTPYLWSFFNFGVVGDLLTERRSASRLDGLTLGVNHTYNAYDIQYGVVHYLFYFGMLSDGVGLGNYDSGYLTQLGFNYTYIYSPIDKKVVHSTLCLVAVDSGNKADNDELTQLIKYYAKYNNYF